MAVRLIHTCPVHRSIVTTLKVNDLIKVWVENPMAMTAGQRMFKRFFSPSLAVLDAVAEVLFPVAPVNQARIFAFSIKILCPAVAVIGFEVRAENPTAMTAGPKLSLQRTLSHRRSQDTESELTKTLYVIH